MRCASSGPHRQPPSMLPTVENAHPARSATRWRVRPRALRISRSPPTGLLVLGCMAARSHRSARENRTENRGRGRPSKRDTRDGRLGFADLARASTGKRPQAEAAALAGLLPAAPGDQRRARDAARDDQRRAWRAHLRAAEAGRPAWALRLTLGGAPATWHVVAGLPGAYHPDRLTPAGGGQGWPAVAQARAAGTDPGCPVELVAVTAADARAELAAIGSGEPPAELSARHLVAAVRARSPGTVESVERQVRRDRARARELLAERLAR